MRLDYLLRTSLLFTIAQCRLILQPYDQDYQGNFPEPKHFRKLTKLAPKSHEHSANHMIGEAESVKP